MRVSKQNHQPERHSIHRMGAGTLVGFLALAGVAAAAAGVSSERNVRDLATIGRAGYSNRAGYGDMRGGYGETRGGYGDIRTGYGSYPAPETLTKPDALVVSAPVISSGGVVSVINGAYNKTFAGFVVSAFTLTTEGSSPITLKKLNVRMTDASMNEAAKKLALTTGDSIRACGLRNFNLQIVAQSGTATTTFGSAVPVVSKNGIPWEFAGNQKLEPGTSYTVALVALEAAKTQQMQKALDGCQFTPYILGSDVRGLSSVSSTQVKVGVNGDKPGILSTKPVVIGMNPKTIVQVDEQWNSISPVGASTKGMGKVIGVINVLNIASSSPDNVASVNLSGLPMNLHATFVPAGDRMLTIYRGTVSPANIVYTKTLNQKSWRKDSKTGFYAVTVGSPFLNPWTIASGTTQDFYVTYDLLDAKVNDTLCVSPTRTLTSFSSLKGLKFPEGSSGPSTRCLVF